MSWHHEDYINLISSLGGLGSAIFAAYATYQARKSTDISKLSLERTERQNEISRIMDELVRLSERCNNCIGEDSHIVETIEKVSEMAAACFYAEKSIISSNVSDSDRQILTDFFIRHLRPGVLGEIENAEALKKVGMKPHDKDLRDIYRDAQIFLQVDEPSVIYEPRIS